MDVEEIHILAVLEGLKLVGPYVTVHRGRKELMAVNVRQDIVHNQEKAFQKLARPGIPVLLLDAYQPWGMTEVVDGRHNMMQRMNRWRIWRPVHCIHSYCCIYLVHGHAIIKSTNQ